MKESGSCTGETPYFVRYIAGASVVFTDRSHPKKPKFKDWTDVYINAKEIS